MLITAQNSWPTHIRWVSPVTVVLLGNRTPQSMTHAAWDYISWIKNWGRSYENAFFFFTLFRPVMWTNNIYSWDHRRCMKSSSRWADAEEKAFTGSRLANLCPGAPRGRPPGTNLWTKIKSADHAKKHRAGDRVRKTWMNDGWIKEPTSDTECRTRVTKHHGQSNRPTCRWYCCKWVF